MSADIRIGTAGWSIPSQYRPDFPEAGSHLERYAGRLNAVEINSSFYRPHRRATYERWSASVPPDFRFSVKLPKQITHEHRLVECAPLIRAFAGQADGLAEKLGVVLVQLPPSLIFDEGIAARFFTELRAEIGCPVACEPRHPSWFSDQANRLLETHEIARVAADPAPVPDAGLQGGWTGLRYVRLHGSPVIYRSVYGEKRLAAYAAAMLDTPTDTPAWFIFDNTADMAATGDSLLFRRMIATRSRDRQ